MRAVWDFGGLATGTLALIASQVVDQLPGLPGLSPWLNYGGLGLLAVTLLGLLYREQQRTKEQQEAFALEREKVAAEREKASERYERLTAMLARIHDHQGGE